MSIKRKVLSVSVDMDVYDSIDKMSKDTRISRSVLVNDMVVDHLKKGFGFRKIDAGDLGSNVE